MRISSRLLAAAMLTSLFASHANAQSITDRFKSLFGSGSSQPAAPSPAQPGVPPDLTCPEVSIRSGASTYAVGLPGKPAAGADLRYQVSITRTARECQLNAGVISVKIGVQGRVIAGPAQAPTTVDIPMRMAVVFETVGQSRTIATKAFRTQVAMTPDGTVPFTLIMEDIAYPVPPGAEGDYYTFYIGFDPQALTPERPAAKKKK